MSTSLDEAMKTCTKCRQSKPLSEFVKDAGKRDGLFIWCKACCKSKRAVSYAANRDKILAEGRLKYSKNAEKLRAAALRRHYANRAQNNANARAWYAANRERVKVRHNAWLSDNPGSRRSYEATRRARKRAVGGNYTADDIKILMALQKGKCAVCRIDIERDYQVDHIMPLVRRGRNERSNLQLLCRPCNQSKHAKDPIEFMRSRGLLL